MVSKTAVLELEWVMRGYYGFSTAEVGRVMRHLLSLPQVTVEDRQCVVQAVPHCDAGLEFADALHHSSCRACESVASFDDRKFGRRARRLGLTPRIAIPL
jgi:predicted nucleic-acid-binding protein